MSEMALIDRVNALEKALQETPQEDCPIWHHFAPGLYARKMLIREGIVLTGAVHKTEHLCIISGDISFTTVAGVIRVKGCQEVFKSNVKDKRALYAHTDTFFTTLHVTETTDLEKLVEELTESKVDELLDGKNNVQFANMKKLKGRS